MIICANGMEREINYVPEKSITFDDADDIGSQLICSTSCYDTCLCDL